MEGNIRWVIITAIAPIAWGATYFVTRQFLPADTPLYGALLRALPAGLVLLAIRRRRPHGSWWWKSVVLGTINIAVFFVLVYVAAQVLPSSVASTIMATSAAVMMLVAWPLLSDRPRARGLAGAALGFLGVCIMLLTGAVEVNPLGVAASVAAMLLSSLGFILTKKWSSEVDVVSLTAWQLIAGALVIAPVAMMVEGPFPALDASAVIAFAFVSLIATALAFAAWFTGLKHLPAGTVGLIGLLNPVTGVLLGTLAASEVFGAQQLLGLVLVLAGIVLGQSRRRHPVLLEPSASR
ncbi:MAG: EamA family transporter [Salinibacterium sp.]|nr:EamA family transporter [Salinibacterium sp.]